MQVWGEERPVKGRSPGWLRKNKEAEADQGTGKRSRRQV